MTPPSSPSDRPASQTSAADGDRGSTQAPAPPVDGGHDDDLDGDGLAAPIAATGDGPGGDGRSARGGGLASRTFDSLRDDGFRWYLTAMLGHFASMNMQQLVRGYLVFDLTGSFALLGLMALANATPRLALALIGGVLADRYPKKHMIQASQAANVVITLAIGMLIFANLLRFEHLLASAFVQGSINALAMPSRQSVIPEIVGMDRLTNAVALNAATRNVVRLVAPAGAGFLLAVVGAAWVYFLMAGLYLIAVITMSKVPVPDRRGSGAAGRRRGGARGALSDIAAGFRYIAGHSTLMMLLSVHLVIVLFSMPYQRMLPGYVAEVLNAGPQMLGILLSVTAVGSLVGSLFIASLQSRERGKVLLLSSLVLGLALLVFAASQSLWLTAPIMMVIGVVQSIRGSLNQVLIQSNVDDEHRGRVMSIFTMEMGLISFGAFGVGILSATFGVQQTLFATALALVAVVLAVTAFVPRYRRLD